MSDLTATPEPTHPPVSESGENQPLPEGYVCPEGYVPGWLNADGLPTSCVGDLAQPELGQPEIPVVTQPVAPYMPRELAATGSDAGVVFSLLLPVAVLLGAGLTLWKMRK